MFDTETTGTEHSNGDRVVEIGCIELVNYIPTGRFHHVYVNPARAMSAGALEVHGLSDEFLSDKPFFAAIADELHAFFGQDARLVAHNATFDIAFLNAEFGRTGHPILTMERVVDTLSLARRKHPGAANSLDALCQRYGIDNSRRTKHGALLDAELLAEVYVELIGGKQADLDLVLGVPSAVLVPVPGAILLDRTARPARVPRITDAERTSHLALVETLGSGAVWRDYIGDAGIAG